MENERKAVVRRAAFDIGSGSTKLQCSDCELTVNTVSGEVLNTRIVTSLYGIERPVQFGADFKCSSDGRLSERIQQEGLIVFKELRDKAEALGAEEFHAIATEVFRKAANGPAYLELIRALGVNVTILTQEMEAELGFGSVQAELAFNASPAAECVWDSGGKLSVTTPIENCLLMHGIARKSYIVLLFRCFFSGDTICSFGRRFHGKDRIIYGSAGEQRFHCPPGERCSR